MRTVKGVYDGQDIKLLESVQADANTKVLITFLQETFVEGKKGGLIEPEPEEAQMTAETEVAKKQVDVNKFFPSEKEMEEEPEETAEEPQEESEKGLQTKLPKEPEEEQVPTEKAKEAAMDEKMASGEPEIAEISQEEISLKEIEGEDISDQISDISDQRIEEIIVKTIEQIASEIVPKIAEKLIKEEIRRLQEKG
jgi:hypothetical protein